MTQPPRDASRPVSPENEGPTAVGFLALVLAWLVPGLGHMLIGQRARGLIFFATLHLLFAGGMLIGGIRAINPPEQAIWTYTQMLTGWPMLIANRVEQGASAELAKEQNTYNQARPPLVPGQGPNGDPLTPAQERAGEKVLQKRRIDYATGMFAKYPLLTYHPKVQDIGAVYCGIAGMLNLLVMFDVLLRITGSTRELPPGKRAAFDGGDSAAPARPAPARPASPAATGTGAA